MKLDFGNSDFEVYTNCEGQIDKKLKYYFGLLRSSLCLTGRKSNKFFNNSNSEMYKEMINNTLKNR